MRKKAKLEHTVIIPTYLGERFESLNLEGRNRNVALKFLRLLSKNSKRINDDNDMFNEVEFSYNYLSKSLGGSYNKVVNKLVEAKIVNRNDFYSAKSHKCKKFSFNKEGDNLFREIINKEINNILIGVKDNLIHTMSIFLQLGLFKEFSYEEKLDPQSLELTENFREALSYVRVKCSKLDNLMADHLTGIKISNFKVNEQITQLSICIGDPNNKYSWRKRDNLIEKAKAEGKLLIQDKNRFFTMTEEEFIEKKRKDVLLSHSGIIRRLERGEYFASRNSTNNRLDTNFTSMPSYMFKSILEDNNMVELDLCNSQMAIFTLVCDLETEDYNSFKNLALNCNLYPYIQGQLSLSSVEEAKKVCFSVLFSDYKNRDSNIVRFKELFPTVMEWINNYKKEYGSKNFSVMLQKKEAEIFIDNIYQRLVNEGLLVFTKHDSLAVREEDEKTVRKIMEDYFKEIDFQVMIR